jgi:hypothetical protein
MRSPINRLPSRFPVGTRYVIAARHGRIYMRYLEFPDGRRIDLPVDGTSAKAASPRRRHRVAGVHQSVKKNLGRSGTADRVAG